ncbi:MAG: thiamine pyrophosphate-dependent dehydrogenase E1 component subunit alpha, partial [Spirochaetota bacterium]
EDTIKKKMYITMLRIREFENRAIKEYRKGNIPGFIHPSIGQEAMAAGFTPFIKKEDYFLCTHRGHGVVVAKGAKTDMMMAELFGKETGYCKGKAGSIHIAAFDLNIVGANGIVGANIPIASGVALACKLRKPGTITVCFFGDGATCTGAFHEGVSFAAAFSLPIVFVISNNQFALSTSPSYHSRQVERLSDKAKGYGLPGITVDGNDAVAVGEAAQKAIDHARNGKGPTVIEGVTFRIYGHHLGDPGTGYRKEEDVEKAKKHDPIILLRKRLLNEGIITEKDDERIVADAREEMEKAVEFALNSREPSPEDALKDVYYSS